MCSFAHLGIFSSLVWFFLAVNFLGAIYGGIQRESRFRANPQLGRPSWSNQKAHFIISMEAESPTYPGLCCLDQSALFFNPFGQVLFNPFTMSMFIHLFSFVDADCSAIVGWHHWGETELGPCRESLGTKCLSGKTYPPTAAICWGAPLPSPELLPPPYVDFGLSLLKYHKCWVSLGRRLHHWRYRQVITSPYPSAISYRATETSHLQLAYRLTTESPPQSAYPRCLAPDLIIALVKPILSHKSIVPYPLLAPHRLARLPLWASP